MPRDTYGPTLSNFIEHRQHRGTDRGPSTSPLRMPLERAGLRNSPDLAELRSAGRVGHPPLRLLRKNKGRLGGGLFQQTNSTT